MTVLVVSDLHLDGARPEIARQFREFLAQRAARVRALYILGDLFEAWIGDDDPDPHKRAVVADLRQLTLGGVALFFMHGNRDFLLGSRFAAEVGGSLMVDPTVVEWHGRRALLTHGDALCTDDVPYQRLRALVREPVWRAQFLALSIAQRQALAEEARAGSKAHTAGQVPVLMDVNPEAVAQVFRDAQVETLVHGHTHRPGSYPHEVDGRRCTRLVTGDWYTQGSVLVWDEQGLRLEGLPRA